MSIKEDIYRSLKWSAIEKVLTQGIQFIFGIILARILSPGDFGIFSLLLILVGYLQIFVDGGFSKALIQNQERTSEDISTIFYFNFIVSLAGAFLIYLGADFLSDVIGSRSISQYIASVSGLLIINAFLIIPTTLLSIELNFKALAKVNFISSFIAGIISILFAMKGFGIWALIIQVYIRFFLSTVILFIVCKWLPGRHFSRGSFRKLYPFGSNLLFSGILNMTVNNASSFFIGKYLSINDLGYYSRGAQFTDTFFSTFISILDNALLPTLSKIKDDVDELIQKISQVIRNIGLIVIPFYTLLIFLAEPIVILLLTTKWVEAVPVIQILSLARMISVISTVNVNLLYVLGKTDLALKQQYVKISVRIVLLLLTFKFGIVYIALGELLNTVVAFFVNTYYPGRIMKFGSKDQIVSLYKIIIASLIMGLVLYSGNKIIHSDYLKIGLGVPVGLGLYMLLIYLFDRKNVELLIKLK